MQSAEPAETIVQFESWMAQIDPELAVATHAWATGNAGKGRVGSRRAAGMALKAWLCLQSRQDYGTSFMHHLNAMADDPGPPTAVREAAWRLAARPVPEGGFQAAMDPALTPMLDARTIITWVVEERSRLAG